MQRGFKAFTLPIAARNPMTTLQAHVDNVRKRVERVRSMAGPNTDFVLDGAGSQKPGEAAAIATALEKVHRCGLTSRRASSRAMRWPRSPMRA
jgi:L-alanine-DL-glutamate epimerase-like enolase superfamily enzyme